MSGTSTGFLSGAEFSDGTVFKARLSLLDAMDHKVASGDTVYFSTLRMLQLISPSPRGTEQFEIHS